MHSILRKTLKYLLWLSVNVAVIVSVILLIAVVNYVNKLPPIEELLDDRKRGSVTLLTEIMKCSLGEEINLWYLKSNVLNRVCMTQ